MHDYRDADVTDYVKVPFCLCGWSGKRSSGRHDRHEQFVGHLVRMMKSEGASPAELVDIVFDSPPSVLGGRFIEVEDMDGNSVSVGRWLDRGDRTWALRLAVVDE